MLSNTVRLERAERAAQIEREREAAQIKAQCAAMSDEELDAVIGDLVGDWEAAHGPVEPRDFASLFHGLDRAEWDARMASLSDLDFVAWRKHD